MKTAIRIVALTLALTLAAGAVTKNFSPARYPNTGTVVSFHTSENGRSAYVDMFDNQLNLFPVHNVRVYVIKTSLGTELEVACRENCWLSVGQSFPYRTDGNFIWVPFSFWREGKKNQIRYFEQSFYVSSGQADNNTPSLVPVRGLLVGASVPQVPPIQTTPPIQLPRETHVWPQE